MIHPSCLPVRLFVHFLLLIELDVQGNGDLIVLVQLPALALVESVEIVYSTEESDRAYNAPPVITVQGAVSDGDYEVRLECNRFLNFV